MTRDIERRLAGALTAIAEQITEETLPERPPLTDEPTVVDLTTHHPRQRLRARWLAPLLAAASVAAAAVVAIALTHRDNGSPTSPSGQTSTTHQPSPHSTTVSATPLLPLGKEEGRSEVPWAQVGPGWTLNYVQSEETRSIGSLYLLNPLGGRYLLASGSPEPAAWSPDGQRALYIEDSANDPNATIVERDLRTFGVLHRFAVPVAGLGALTYTRPVGKAVVAGSGFDGLAKYGFDGAVQARYPKSTTSLGLFISDPLYAPDGLHFFMGTQRGIAYIGNGGEIAREIPSPAGYENCRPHHMVDATTVTISCDHTANGSVSDVFEYSTTTGNMTRVTTTNIDGQHGLGYVDEFATQHGTFLATAQGCGGETVSTLNPDGTGTPLDIPRPSGVTSRLSLVAVEPSAILMRASGCAGSQKVLIRYDLTTHMSAVVLGPGATGGSIAYTWSFEPQK